MPPDVECTQADVPWLRSVPVAAAAMALGTRRQAPEGLDTAEPAVPSETSGAPLPPLVAVIDDDESVRESLPDLLRAFGFSAQAFDSAEDFLESDCMERADCLILDISMPGMTGPELQKELAYRREVPIVFITAHTNPTMRSRVMKAGAVACLLKPFGESVLLAALNKALGTDT